MSQDPSTGSCQPDKCASCPTKGTCGSSTESDANREVAAKMRDVGRIIVVLSGKGGVGKSTVATQLAYQLAVDEKNMVALTDIDICGPSIPTMTNTQGAEVHQSALGWEPVSVLPNLSVVSIGFMLNNADDPVILRGPKKHGVIVQFLKDVNWNFDHEKKKNNYLIIDTPPGTSDEHLSVINVLSAASRILNAEEESPPEVYAVIVSTPQEVALADVRKEVNFCKQIKLDIRGVIENMSGFVCPCCNKATDLFTPTSGGVQQLCKDYDIPFLGRIPLDPILTAASESGKAWKDAIESGSKSLGIDMFVSIVEKLK
ncbi:Nucleotide-binding protein 35 [Giardia muris]|uniref:Nucleotide-binding protein 35 n=1 Tax=Giardia muris TaxID=5742 RepID=A0A4Z1TCE2_GIAMU|nr:Nucleotide-binding protein 35 [Giardia muris]|eukprot:TNJ30249.1 Nucleotide-binding protein 35 [Giardia muris]